MTCGQPTPNPDFAALQTSFFFAALIAIKTHGVLFGKLAPADALEKNEDELYDWLSDVFGPSARQEE